MLQAELDAESLFPVQVVLTADPGEEAALLAATGLVATLAGQQPQAAQVLDVTSLPLPPELLGAALVGGAPLPAEAQPAVAGLWASEGGLVSRVVARGGRHRSRTEQAPGRAAAAGHGGVSRQAPGRFGPGRVGHARSCSRPRRWALTRGH